MTRSAMAFARGARNGVSSVSMPRACALPGEVAPVDRIAIPEQVPAAGGPTPSPRSAGARPRPPSGAPSPGSGRAPGGRA